MWQDWQVVLEMVKVAEEARVDMINNLVNHNLVGVIPAEWELSTIVNCYQGKGDFLEGGNYGGMKLQIRFCI